MAAIQLFFETAKALGIVRGSFALPGLLGIVSDVVTRLLIRVSTAPMVSVCGIRVS